jgi:hypothetical protein
MAEFNLVPQFNVVPDGPEPEEEDVQFNLRVLNEKQAKYLKDLHQLDVGLTYLEDGEQYSISRVPGKQKYAQDPLEASGIEGMESTTAYAEVRPRPYKTPDRFVMPITQETTTYNVPSDLPGGAPPDITLNGISQKNQERALAVGSSEQELEFARSLIRNGFSEQEALATIEGLDKEPWMMNPLELSVLLFGAGAYRGANIAIKTAIEGGKKHLGKRMIQHGASVMFTGMPTEIALGGIAEELDLRGHTQLSWLLAVAGGLAMGFTVEDMIDRRLIMRTDAAISRFPDLALREFGKDTVNKIRRVARETKFEALKDVKKIYRDVESQIVTKASEERGAFSLKGITVGAPEAKAPPPPEIQAVMRNMPPDYQLSYDGTSAGLHYFTPHAGPGRGGTFSVKADDFTKETLTNKLVKQEEMFSQRPMPEPPKPDPQVNFEKWLGKSVVREPVYHGTLAQFDEFSMFMGEGFAHVGTKSQAEGIIPRGQPEWDEITLQNYGKFGDHPSIMPLYVRIENPVRLHDIGGFDPPEIAHQLIQKGIFNEEDWDKVNSLTRKKRISYVRKRLEDVGHDGIVYLNRQEGVNWEDYNELAAEKIGTTGPEAIWNATDKEYLEIFPAARDSYIPLRPNQIKSVYNTGEWNNYTSKLSYAMAPALSVETDEDGNPHLSQPMLLGTIAVLGSALGVRKFKTGRTKWGKYRQVLKKEIPNIEREASRKKMSVSKYLAKEGWAGVKGDDIPAAVRTNIQAWAKAEKDMPFVKEIGEMAQDAIDFKHTRNWYRETNFNRLINSDSKEEVMEFLGLVAETSRRVDPYRNLKGAMKVWLRHKAGQPMDEIVEGVGLAKPQVIKLLTEGKDFFNVAYDIYGRRLGNSWKIQDFAETLYHAIRDPQKLKGFTRAVIDFRMNQYLFPYRDWSTGTLTEIGWERANERLLEVRDHLRKFDNPDWDIDMVQAALWHQIKQERLAKGLDVPTTGSGKRALSFGESVTQMVSDYGNIPPYSAVFTRETMPRELKVFVRQSLNGKERNIFDHYSNKNFMTALPEKQGTGIMPGRERARPDAPKKIHMYEARTGELPEQPLWGAEHKYRAVVDSDRIYNLDTDADRYMERYPDVTEREWAMIKDGWIGQSSGRVSILYHPTRVHEMKKFKLGFSPISSPEKITGLRKAGSTPRADLLEMVMGMEARGDHSSIHELVQSSVKEHLDHPLIDVIYSDVSEGGFDFKPETSFNIIVEAGNEKILRGRFARMLNEYAQDEGYMWKIENLDGKAPRPPSVPKGQEPSVFVRFPEDLTGKQRGEIQEILSDNGIGGSEYIPNTNILHIAHVTKYMKAAEYNRAINNFIGYLNLNGFSDIQAKRVWVRNDVLSNDWVKNPTGKTYEGAIYNGKREEQNRGFLSKPPVVRGGGERGVEVPTKELLGFGDVRQAAKLDGRTQNPKSLTPRGEEVTVEDPFRKTLEGWKRPEPPKEPPTTTVRLPYETITGPAAGVWYGAEQDEEGNWRLNPEKALKGALIGVLAGVGLRNRKKLVGAMTKTYTENIGEPIWNCIDRTFKAGLKWMRLGRIFDVDKDPLLKKMFSDFRRDTQRLWLRAVKAGEELKRLEPTPAGQKRLVQVMKGGHTSDTELAKRAIEFKGTFDELRNGLKAYDLMQYSRFDIITRKQRAALRFWINQDFTAMDRKGLVGFAREHAPDILQDVEHKTPPERLLKRLMETQKFKRNRLNEYYHYGSAQEYVPLMYEKYEGLTRKNKKNIERTAKEYRKRATRAPEQDTKDILNGMADELEELTGKKYSLTYKGRRGGRSFQEGLSQAYGHRRKDMPVEVQRAMGWIEEAAYPAAKAIGEQSTDLRKAQMYKYISVNPDWARTENTMIKGLPQHFTKVTDSRLGALNDMYVRNDVLADLREVADFRDGFVKMWDKAMGLYKAGKVVYNPAAQIRNGLSNAILAYMGDVNPATPEGLKAYGKALEALMQRENNKLWQEAEEWGLFANTFHKAELYELRTDIDSLRNLKGSAYSKKVKSLVKKIILAPSEAYDVNEKLFKLAIFAKARADGMDIDKAGRKAEKHLFNYSDVPPVVKFGKRWVSPFMTFSYKAMPLFAETCVTKPWKIAAIGAAMYGMEEYAKNKLGYSGEMFKEMKEKQPDWTKGKMFRWFGPNLQVLTPWRDKWGNDLYFDLAYILPFGAIGEQWYQSELSFREFMPTGPHWSIIGALAANKDLFSGREIISEIDRKAQYSAARVVGKYLWYINQQLNTPLAPGGHGFDKLLTGVQNYLRDAEGEEPILDWAGRPRDLGTAVVSSLLGIKLNPMNQERMKKFEMMERSNLIRAIGKEKGKVRRKKKRNVIDQGEYLEEMEKLNRLHKSLLKGGD